MTMMVTVKNILENHLYMFKSELYRQLTDGPIGDNITMVASELVMYDFDTGCQK